MFEKIEHHLRNRLIYILTGSAAFILLFLFCKAMGYSLALSFVLIFLAIHLSLAKKTSGRLLLHLGLLLTLIVFTSHIIVEYSTIPPLYVPVAAVAIITMLLFNDLHLMFVMAFISTVFVSMILGGNFSMMLILFVGSLAGAYAAKEARTRSQLLNAGVFASAAQVVCLFLTNPDYTLFLTREFTFFQLYPLAASGFISVFVVGATLKIFEYLFGVLTNYSLLELSDFNHPLLKRMILEAPGTYHHSLVVSNLAEAAADAVGANALLTRVGAYYHDIGKMVKPEYFTENQLVGGNKHDLIEPSMSRLVILNHVKEGIELAKKNKLNQAIIDFIPQHHGTSLMHYFYQKSLEEAEDDETVSEEDFRYPGPKPQTRETAITLLADSVEGATRALDEPSPRKIEETVKKIINNKFIDGQLDECNLTLKDIDKISRTFIRILSAMYHGRIKYPEKKDAHNNRKSSEKNTSQPPTPQKDRGDNPSS